MDKNLRSNQIIKRRQRYATITGNCSKPKRAIQAGQGKKLPKIQKKLAAWACPVRYPGVSSALREMGFEIDSLLPKERTGSDTGRYYLRRGDSAKGLENLRELLNAVRTIDSKVMKITRFKGLPEIPISV